MVEYFDALTWIDCPRCNLPVEFGISVGYQPTFLLHPRKGEGERAACRLAVFRHPITKLVCVRVVPTRWEDYFPLLMQELRAVAGKAGLL